MKFASILPLAITLVLGVPVILALPDSLAIAQSSVPAPPPAQLKEIHVDRKCGILLEESDALSGLTEADVQNDHAICHLESVFTSHHVEEALRDGVMQHNNVSVKEQEYLLQNITAEPVTFVVEHVLLDGWEIDSDPQPVRIVDNKAFFRVNAAPGQIVRMHVGEHQSNPISDGK